MMAEFPIMPLRVADLLADTYHMSTEEFGAYVRILITMWQHGGRLAERNLQKISGLSQYSWRRSVKNICEPLTIIGGTVSQKRLEDTRLKVQEKRAKAQASVGVRWARRQQYERNTDVERSIIRNGYESHTTKTKKERILTPTEMPRDGAPQQEGKEAAAEGQNGFPRIDQMKAAEIADRLAARREADEALAEAKRRKLRASNGAMP